MRQWTWMDSLLGRIQAFIYWLKGERFTAHTAFTPRKEKRKK